MRKLRELMIARRLEAELKKSRILELYLNVIEWGDGIYGVEAASREYFKASAASLGPEESALLAGAIVNPRLLNPAKPTQRTVEKTAADSSSDGRRGVTRRHGRRQSDDVRHGPLQLDTLEPRPL